MGVKDHRQCVKDAWQIDDTNLGKNQQGSSSSKDSQMKRRRCVLELTGLNVQQGVGAGKREESKTSLWFLI